MCNLCVVSAIVSSLEFLGRICNFLFGNRNLWAQPGFLVFKYTGIGAIFLVFKYTGIGAIIVTHGGENHILTWHCSAGINCEGSFGQEIYVLDSTDPPRNTNDNPAVVLHFGGIHLVVPPAPV